jgi:hypothetical protein
MADESAGVVNLIKHKVRILILPTQSADVIAIAPSQTEQVHSFDPFQSSDCGGE